MDFMKAFMDQNNDRNDGRNSSLRKYCDDGYPTRWRGNMFMDMMYQIFFIFLAMNIFKNRNIDDISMTKLVTLGGILLRLGFAFWWAVRTGKRLNQAKSLKERVDKVKNVNEFKWSSHPTSL